MTLPLDPQIAAALTPILENAGEVKQPPGGDVGARRTAMDGMLAAINGIEAVPDDVSTTDHQSGRIQPVVR
ncbi:hypothetical protein AB0K20_32125 [Micromonospora matsumotoense]|uniref:hypothetical protein n=1 Tax=Micromonospora matsumotoense TaxID=121616 RepID=UPI003434F91C